MASSVPEFLGLDTNDVWLTQCEAQGCSGNHNILTNTVKLLPSHQIMNWWDFLDVLECYEQETDCGVCTNCCWCRYYFKNLLGEAWGLTWNNWRTKKGQFFVAVCFSPHNEHYTRRPMTVEPWGRRVLSPLEKQLVEEKEKKKLFR